MIRLRAYWAGHLVWTWEGPSLTRELSGCVIEDGPEWEYVLTLI